MSHLRSKALGSLVNILCHGAYSNIELKNALADGKLTPSERGLYKQLVFGTLERIFILDAAINRVSTMKTRKMSPMLLNAVRLGVYGLLYSEHTPPSRTVNETVALVKKVAPSAAGLCNAILRNLPTLPEILSGIHEPHIRYCVDESIYTMLTSAYGREKAHAYLEGLFAPAPVVARVNTLKTTSDALIKILAQEGVEAVAAGPEHALTLRASRSIEGCESYRQGLFHLQGLSSQHAVAALSPVPGSTLLDVCCAPGGKAFTAAQWMQNQGKIYGFDLHPHRVTLIEKGARRLGINCIETAQHDATTPLPGKIAADLCLCDVPCSALGQLHRHPELRMRRLAEFDALPKTQYTILSLAAEHVKPGGRLLYATCTLNPAENDGVADRFAEDFPHFSPSPLEESGTTPGTPETPPGRRTLMAPGAEGFYLALFERKS